jgi:hypothetical protein
MKKLIYSLMLVFVTIACQEDTSLFEKQNQTSKFDQINAASGAPVTNYTTAASYTNTYSFSPDGKTITITIDQSSASAKNISHLNFKFGGTLAATTKTTCGDDALSIANIVSFTANGVDMMSFLGSTEGVGGDCYGMLADPFVKLDHGFSAPIVVLVISFDVPVYNGVFLLKAGSANSPTGGGCFGLNDPNYSFSRPCVVDLPKCYQEESAWAAGSRYVSRGNWATYTPYSVGSVNVYAGQNKFAAVATFSAVSGGNVTITIVLNEGWSLQEVTNPVKIQGYSVAPTGNPSPGRFASKGGSLTVTVPAANYYGIHLDVRQAVECPL